MFAELKFVGIKSKHLWKTSGIFAQFSDQRGLSQCSENVFSTTIFPQIIAEGELEVVLYAEVIGKSTLENGLVIPAVYPGTFLMC